MAAFCKLNQVLHIVTRFESVGQGTMNFYLNLCQSCMKLRLSPDRENGRDLDSTLAFVTVSGWQEESNGVEESLCSLSNEINSL